MMQTETMQRVRIIALQDDVEQVINELVDFGVIHVTRSKQGGAGEPLEKFDQIASELVWLRACEKILGGEKAGYAKVLSFNGLRPLDELLSEAAEFKKKAGELMAWNEELQETRGKESALASRMRELEPFKNLALSPALLKSAALEFRHLPLKTTREGLLNAAKGLRATFLFSQPGKATWVLAAFDSKQAGKMDAVFAAHCGPAVEFPKITAANFSEEWKIAEKGLAQAAERANDLEGKISGFMKKHFSTVIALRYGMEVHARKSELPSRFGKTTSLEIIEGWVPFRLSAGLGDRLRKKFSDKILVEMVETADIPPTKLANPRLIRGFEFLVKFFSLPGYGEWDPTILIAISFPIIFGMILGDIGYGLVALAIALVVRKKFRSGFFHSAASMLVFSAIMTTLFGVVYGEFFGTEELLGLKMHPFVERGGEGVNLLLGLALLVGVIHVATGLIVGVAWNAAMKHYRHAVAKAFWLMIEAALIIISASVVLPQFVAGLPSPMLLGTGMAVVALVGLYFSEGYTAIFEVPSMLVNVLSYLRIMALGLSGVILAKIVNQIPVGAAFAGLVAAAGRADAVGIVGSLLSFAIFAVILVGGHAGALALGLFESSIQALRLHYVEFFSKFYHGGGFPFVPLNEEIRGG
ncbi:MAG: hypothetical protein NTY90_03145 [Candidatus Micrarchaeota archaeon]|nr:hypothetical protein [Candidatus Micrarchaeota archaeon]